MRRVRRSSNKMLEDFQRISVALNEVKTPKLYEKILMQYKHSMKNKKAAKIIDATTATNIITA